VHLHLIYVYVQKEYFMRYFISLFPRKKRRYPKVLFLFHVALLLLLLLLLSPRPAAHAQGTRTAAAYTVSGIVYNDYNQNGTQDNSASIVEPGIDGVIVTAYDAAGGVVTSATTSTVASVLGKYTLSIPAGTGPVRVQFSNFGSTSAIPDLTSLQSSNHVGGTSVQFVSGASATNTIDLGLERPAEYCQNQPTIATSCYVVGDQTATNPHVMVSFPSTASATSPAPSALANYTAVGATWGLAYRRSSDSLFASAFMKRHASFKPSGSTGAIYLISGANTATPGTPSLFVDLNVAVSAGVAGANPHDTTNYNLDAASYDQVGKVSLGGLAMSDDDATLYVMNLADKKLYSIAVGSPPAAPSVGTISSTAVPVPASCSASDLRPFAVTSYHGLIYVGAVCSAESTVTGPLPLGDPTKLFAYVFAYTPGSGFTAAPVFQTSLNYTRHCANDTQYADCTASGSANLNVGNPSNWNPWHTGFIGYRDLGHNATTTATVYPQPILSSIQFDNGNLVLGLRDRFGDQGGHVTTLTPDGSRQLYSITAGDALRACLNTPGTFSSGWTLENNATCGGITTAGANNTRLGPGGGQYYYQNFLSPNHDNLATGSVLQIPGSPSMITTVFNPVGTFNTGGVRWDNNTTGAQTNAYQVYAAASILFDKANGLGSLTAFCQAAPIEIGNRVWNDANGNGLQDAGEAGIAGATVHLYAANGTTLLSTTTTDATGSYTFPISSYTAYVVKLDTASDYASGGVLYHLRLTLANQDPNSLIDSAATLPTPTSAIGTNNYPTIAIATHTPGQNDHSFDIGLTLAPDFFVGKTSALSYGNLALSAAPTASSTLTAGGWALSAVNDGILTSTGSSMGWTSNLTTSTNHTEWIQLDLRASYPIQAINLYPRNDTGNVGYGFPINFTIATSTDGTTWTTQVSKTGYALPGSVQMFTFPNQTTRYVRVTGTNLRSNPNDANRYRMQFAEITIY
jgi:hypothetical protein